MGETAGLTGRTDFCFESGKAMEKSSIIFRAAIIARTVVISGWTFLWNVFKRMADPSNGMTFDSF